MLGEFRSFYKEKTGPVINGGADSDSSFLLAVWKSDCTRGALAGGPFSLVTFTPKIFCEQARIPNLQSSLFLFPHILPYPAICDFLLFLSSLNPVLASKCSKKGKIKKKKGVVSPLPSSTFSSTSLRRRQDFYFRERFGKRGGRITEIEIARGDGRRERKGKGGSLDGLMYNLNAAKGGDSDRSPAQMHATEMSVRRRRCAFPGKISNVNDGSERPPRFPLSLRTEPQHSRRRSGSRERGKEIDQH